MATFSCCVKDKQESYFKCSECNIHYHLACLKMREVPGGLLEDVFFEFICKNCSPQKTEEFTRIKLPWITVLVLTLYNLQEKSRGMSKKGYFHWRMHICSFIDRHWNTLFGPQIKRKKNWQGTISGTLSHFSPRFFSSGLQVLNESGWWRLTHSLTPQIIIELYEKVGLKRSNNNKDDDCQINKKLALTSNIATPHETHFQNEKQNIYGVEHILKQETNCDNSDHNLSSPSDSWSNQTKEEICENSCLSSSDYDQSEAIHTDDCSSSLMKCIPNENMDDIDMILTNIDMDEHEMDLNFDFSFDEIEKGLSLKSESSSEDEDSIQSMGKKVDSDRNLNRTLSSSYKFKPLPSLFPANKDETEFSDDESVDSTTTKECTAMSIQDEVILMRRLEQILNYKSDVPEHIRRFYRKLCIRQENRHLNQKVFDLKETCHAKIQKEPAGHKFQPIYKNISHGSNNRILDRFQVTRDSVSLAKQKCPRLFMSSLTGVEELSCFYSPFTGRKLKPYIWQDTDTKPLWIKLLDELDNRVNKNDPNWTPRKQYPIDYCYIQPQHIPIINELCNEHFYPGIDLTECLEYPDFTCVVLYKKLIVAFAIMVPDVSHNEAYISFIFTRPKWRMAGIAKFMLYHLIQTSFGRDITLHVSSKNTAMLLYQKFGFRIDSFEPHFYERYLPFSSTESRHAFFLRLHS